MCITDTEGPRLLRINRNYETDQKHLKRVVVMVISKPMSVSRLKIFRETCN